MGGGGGGELLWEPSALENICLGAQGDCLSESVLLGARNVCLNYLEYVNHNFTCIHAVHLSGPMCINKCVFFRFY